MNYYEKINDAALDGQSAYVFTFDDAADAAAHLRANLKQPYSGQWDSANSWTGGNETPEQSCAYATTGNDALVKLADEYLSQIEHGGIETAGHEWTPSLCGAYPVIGDFLAGRPDCMRRRMETAGERAPVRLILDTTSSGGITASKLERRGAAMLALVMALAAMRPVELWQLTSLDARRKGANGHFNGALLLTRCPTSPLNLGVCAHLLTSQAWTRAVGYGWLRQEALVGGAWSFLMPEGEQNAATYNRLMRAALDCTPQDVLVNGIFLKDELVDAPVDWINKQIALCRETADAFA